MSLGKIPSERRKHLAESVEDATAERTAPKIEPGTGHIYHAGHTHKHMVFAAPAGLTLDDLNAHPEIWSKVQGTVRGGNKLSERDIVELWFEGFDVHARVNYATHNSVVLYDIRKVSKPKRVEHLWQDANFAIFWAPEGGYTYRRKSDNCRMTDSTWPTPESCQAYLVRREYTPQPGNTRVMG